MKPKIIRFNLSRNSIHKKDKQIPKIIIQDSGLCLEDFKTEEEYEKAEEYNYLHPTTLKDICILLYAGCGQGVDWQFSKELSSRLNIDEKNVKKVLHSIISEYAKMDDETAIEKYEELSGYIGN